MKVITIYCFISLFSMQLLANEQSIAINKQLAKNIFSGASDKNFNRSDEQALNYQQLLALHGQQYLWFTSSHKSKQLNLSGLSLVSLLNDLGIKHLPYHLPYKVSHQSLENQSLENLSNLAAADQQLSQQLFYIANLFNGYQLKPVENPRAEIMQAVTANTLANYVDHLLPQFDEVVRLRSAIAAYRPLLTMPWPKLDEKLTFKLGQGHQEVVKIRQILSALRDLAANNYSPYRQHIFDPEVIIALKKFQARHGLKKDGKLSAATIRALNITPQQRINIMQINLWRWLSLPSIPPQRYIRVNIPSYQLSFVEHQQKTLSMKVIVGDKQHPTPIMVTQVNSITINPTWTPTYNIVHNELLLENANNPGSLSRQNFKLAKGYGNKRVFQAVFNDSAAIKKALGEYHLVQAAGKNNALGKYRFNIKNFHSVYLHDTPTKHLFNKTSRALSHGCVRLQSAERLTKVFLNKQLLANSRQVTKAIRSTKTQHFALAQSIPVYLTYQTVRVTGAGELHWYTDIYQQDAAILSQMGLYQNTTKM